MKKLLNTLYVTTQDTYLRKEGETVVVEKEKQVLLRLPIHTLQGIVTFGNVMTSPFLLNLCAERGVCVSYMSESGRFLARVTGPVSGNVLLRLAQMRAYEDKEKKGEIARSFVIGKLLNARNIILRRIRDHGESDVLRDAAEKHVDVVRRVRDSPPDAERLRGLEGEAGAAYFGCFNELLVAQKDEFAISGRNRRHEVRSGRPGLALDLMEEFRAVLSDRVALSLVNLRQVGPRDFRTTESGAVEMKEETRKTILQTWQKKKQETIQHPFLEERVPIGLLPHLQALLLARYLRGDLDAYPPYIQK